MLYFQSRSLEPGKPSSKSSSLLLNLPLEIRLQIYSHLVNIHPAQHVHLSTTATAANTDPKTTFDFLRALSSTHSLASQDLFPTNKIDPLPFPVRSASQITPRGSGCGHVPSALLRSCKQIYLESRLLPWETNEFIFVNWFSSGVYAARAFLRALRPWQREKMRFARVEVLERDLKNTWVPTLTGGRPGSGEWNDLCELWSGGDSKGGLWGLKLSMKGRIGQGLVVTSSADDSGHPEDGELSMLSLNASNQDNVAVTRELGILDVQAGWVVKGLAQMKALHWLEIEIDDDMVDREVKVQFCIDLERHLRAEREKKVTVLFVEKATIVQGSREKQITALEERIVAEVWDPNY